MDNTNPDNDLPHDWDLDSQYEDRWSCLGDAECNEDQFLQENWPEWESDPEADYGDPYLDGEMHQDPNEMYDE